MSQIRGLQAALLGGFLLLFTILIFWFHYSFNVDDFQPNYNQFRLSYSHTIEGIEKNWSMWSDSKENESLKGAFSDELSASHTQLLLYDIEHNEFVFSNLTDFPYLSTEQLQTYLYQDAGIKSRLSGGKYLISYVLFSKAQAVGIGLFIVDRDILLSQGDRLKSHAEKGILAVGIFLLLLLVLYLYILSKRLSLPLKQLEIQAKAIARGQLEHPIDMHLQTGALGVCFYELDRMRQDLLEMSHQNLGYEQSRKELINYLTHDLRTPLASMRALTEGLLDGIAATPEARAQYLNGILKKTEEMERLTSDLFHHANIQLSGFHIEPVEIYFDEMMENMIGSLEINLKAYGGPYGIENNKNHKLVLVDSFRMEQAVMNLIVNAIKYSHEGELIRIFTEQVDNFVVIGVEDKGMGISKEDLPFIFENFYRGEKSRSRKYGGTGLGLSIVKYIAEAHDGYITVKSELGKGSTFKLFLPMV